MNARNIQLDETREKAAAKWLARRDRKLNQAEAAAFESWLAEDVRNSEVLRELEESFRALDCVETLKHSAGARPDPDFLLKRAAPKSEYRPSPKVVHFKAWIAAGAAVAAAVMLTFILARSPLTTEPASPRASGTVVRHVAQTMALPDGSLIELKPGTEVEVQFQAGERRVLLASGEAHFTVAKDPARPFVVAVHDLSVRAVGTAFNVRLRDSAVEVLVTEGKVAVRDAAQPGGSPSNAIDVPLVAGDRAVVAAYGENRVSVASIGADELDEDLAWRAIWLEFVEMRLGEVVEEFNRHNGTRLAVADEATGNVLVSGNFKADGSDAFVRILESSFSITAERQDQVVLLRRQR
jgi:transmembrane sensor